MNFLEQGDAELSAAINKHWREVAEYERYVVPLRIRLQAVDWRALITISRAYWHSKAIDEIRARKQQYGSYCWVGSFCNSRTGAYRKIQRYPLVYLSDFGAYPIRLCPLGEQHKEWGWFRPSDIGDASCTPEADRRNPAWTPESHAWSAYQKQRILYGQALQNIDSRRNKLQPRQYLADRLLSISRQLGKYVRKDQWNANGMFYEEPYELNWYLSQILSNSPDYSSAQEPGNLGELEAKLDYFQLCLKKFHDAETPASVTKVAVNNQVHEVLDRASELSPIVRKRLDYFPQLLIRLSQCPIWDIDEVLNEALKEYKIEEPDLSQGKKFTSRVKHYCKQIIVDDVRSERIMNWAFWAREKENETLRLLEFPELRQTITEFDRIALLARLESVKAGLGIMQRTGKIAEISKWEANIKLVEFRLAELDAVKQKPSESVQPSATLLSNKTALAVIDLCLPPFTSNDLTTLLLYLKALPGAIPHRWNEPPRGKGKGAISKIAAALGVLSSDNLLRDDKEIWSEAIERDYGIRLGAKALDYEYKSHNGSYTFDTATEKSRNWVERWKLTVSDSY